MLMVSPVRSDSVAHEPVTQKSGHPRVWLGGPGLRTLLGFRILPPARAFSLEFLHPVTWDDELTMQVGVSNVGTHSFSFSVEGRLSPDVVAFTASLTQVCVSPDTREVMEVPAQLRALLA
ncbi:acyl-CoA thioesterase [Pseudomonas aeruginosa]|uniref:acyl-CoA thioesterase n=1 Tax=Pseudomonas aeruginosa TaxID=287 RepID=UPI003D286C0F